MKNPLLLLYLASQSPRRREILTRMKVSFQVVPSTYEEHLRQNVLPSILALEHAEGKARNAVVPAKARFVLGADTVVACRGRILGKPKNEQAALAMIRLLAGKKNEVVTGIALLDRETGILTRAASHSMVSIKKMNSAECLNYVRNSQPYDKAGGYAIQGKPRIAKRVSGSYSNIVGFPRELVRRLLKQAGFFAFVFMCVCAGSGVRGLAAESEKVRSEHTEASLVSEYNAFQPGTSIRIALRLRMDPHWHTYWSNSGDSGFPTAIQWTLPEGFSAGPLEWPYPELIRQEPLATHGYHEEAWLFTTLQTPAELPLGSDVTLRARADWLECEVPCLPGRAQLALNLKTSAEPMMDELWKTRADLFLTKLPTHPPAGQHAFIQNDVTVTLQSGLSAQEAHFFPYDSELFDHAAEQRLTPDARGFSLELKRSNLKPGVIQELAGVLVVLTDGARQGYELDLTPSDSLQETPRPKMEEAPVILDSAQTAEPKPIENKAAAVLEKTKVLIEKTVADQPTQKEEKNEQPEVLFQEDKKPISLWLAFAFAFMGGMILNLMPCVLPVLSLKILGFVSQRGEPRKLRAHALIWTLGVLVSFWLLSALMLALRWGGSSLGWGFHLQSPGMVAALAVIFLLLTMNMAGFFEVGLLLTRFAGTASKTDEKNAQAFWAGALAVVAATPCTAPFMGAAVGYSLAQPVPVVLAVFSCLGLGMAFPFLFLAFMPGGLKFLPKPGPWMETFKRILSIPLGLTVLWLLWVLAVQMNGLSLGKAVIALLLTGTAAFLYGRIQPLAVAGDSRAKQKSRWFLGLVIASALLTIAIAASGRMPDYSHAAKSSASDPREGVQWQVFSREAVQRHVQAGKPVFINFTARWCLSCQVNDRLVFRTAEVGKLFKSRGIEAFKADWTSRDDQIAGALAEYERASVPLYVYYAKNNNQPQFLPEVLTPGLVGKALQES